LALVDGALTSCPTESNGGLAVATFFNERYAGFLEALSRKLASGRLLRGEVSEDRDVS
jgi:hypothetical protein